MKYKKSLIIFLYFGYTLKTKYDNTGDFYYFFASLLAIENIPKTLHFLFFISFWRNFAPRPKKKAA